MDFRFAVRRALLAIGTGMILLPTLVAMAADPPGADGIPIAKLVRGLRDEDPRIRATAACALADLGAEAEPAIGSLRLGLRDPDRRVRWAVAIALGRIGPAAKVAEPELVQALSDPHWTVRQAAALALALLKPDRTSLPSLRRMLTDISPDVRRAAFFALQQVPEPTTAAVSRPLASTTCRRAPAPAKP